MPRPSSQKEGRGRASKKWHRATVVDAARQRGVLPAADQAGQDLADAGEAAQILGYKDAHSFLSALGHGLLPELEQPDGYEYRRSSASRPRQQRWKRDHLEELAARRTSAP
ncbi:hypothetical protein [Streptomyces sp. NBC_00140]|uniref:hypothetical protein n=1 Tax=Streptomyces sp. NBC_00140 TaxID=2975664 RepID=UPI002254F393|nr:hypothetical protein [Streptomyces sp. NBC_00140]MCX5336849.1 hypothetical protein [Streptomyces sp. NBC_00140]